MRLIRAGASAALAFAVVACHTTPAVVRPTPRPRPLRPLVRSSGELDPNFWSGQQVFITDSGFKPKWLVSIIRAKVIFTNETQVVRSVALNNKTWESGEIAPGETACYRPDSGASLAYHLEQDPSVSGLIQVEAYFMPGEDPGAPDRLDADEPPASGTPAPRGC